MNIQTATDQALQMRKNIISMLHAAGSGHPGGSLSCTDIISAALFWWGYELYDPQHPE